MQHYHEPNSHGTYVRKKYKPLLYRFCSVFEKKKRNTIANQYIDTRKYNRQNMLKFILML